MASAGSAAVLGRVAALVAPKEVVIKEFEVPEPAPGAVVVRVRRANVCGSELHIWRFHHPLIRHSVLGHEFVGEVVALGEGVTTDYAGQTVGPGDRVVAAYFLTCRRCPACLNGDFNLCQRAYTYWSQPPEKAPHFTGAFGSHYYIQPDQYVDRVPDSVSDAAVAGAVGLSGRSYLNFQVSCMVESLGDLKTEMIREFFRAVSENGRFNLHLMQMNGDVAPHLCEASFKAFAKAFMQAKTRTGDDTVLSTKGLLE